MIRQEQSSIPIAAGTHPGMKGKNNEDRYGVSAFILSNLDRRPVVLAVLSDGIGGHRAGEVASEIAVNQISAVVAASDASRPVETLIAAVQQASVAIQSQATQNSEQTGMGATCACAWVIGDRLYTATVGDSRIYLLRAGRIQRLSIDHTWLQEAVDQGLLTVEQTLGHPNAHVIRRYLGSAVPPEVDVRLRMEDDEDDERAAANQGVQLLSGDRLVLSSDGLTDLVQDEEILKTYTEQPPEVATQTLIDLANARGGHDNITIVTLQIPPSKVQESWVSRNRRKLAFGCVAALLALAALAGLIFGGVWLAGRGGDQKVTPTITLNAPLLGSTATLEEATGAPQASATPEVIAPQASATVQPVLPGDSGPTLTPWPTYTPQP